MGDSVAPAPQNPCRKPSSVLPDTKPPTQLFQLPFISPLPNPVKTSKKTTTPKGGCCDRPRYARTYAPVAVNATPRRPATAWSRLDAKDASTQPTMGLKKMSETMECRRR
ncbi:hypothetical protein MKX07_005786 [Trichoderma sp. CBMAI-0711]|nr:hypothetical protein MKX07_005786 [Trichoderma sp. CBMAI-0711]